MQHFFVKSNQVENDKVRIIGKDVNHIKNVLRCKVNEKIEVSVLENGEKFLVEILEFNNEEILCGIIEVVDIDCESNVKINIIQGLPKSDKMELIIQKCTELGVKEITPLELDRCVVKLSGKDVDKKIARWESIAETAAKQCGRNSITKINKLYNLKNISEVLQGYDLVVVAYEGETEVGLKDVLNELKFKNLQQELAFGVANNFEGLGIGIGFGEMVDDGDKVCNLKDKANFNGDVSSDEESANARRKVSNAEALKIAVIIGPEGGLEEKEVEALKSMGARSVSLGKRILRTETVAIVLSSVIMYELGEFGEV